MKMLIVLFFLAFSAKAQECQQANELSTASTSGATIDNRNRGCQLWNLVYWVEGFSALTIRLEYSIDQSAWTTTTLSLTDTPIGKGNVRIYAPFFRITLFAATGTGKVKYIVGGYKGNYGLSDIVAGGTAGTGDVTAATDFGVDNSILVADGVLKGVKAAACKIVGDAVTCGSTNPGEVQLLEASPGADYISIGAPSSLAATTKYLWPATAPSGNQILQFGTPSAGISTGTFVTNGGGGVLHANAADVPACTASFANMSWHLDDGITTQLCDGAAIQHYHQGQRVYPPGPLSGWTQVNSPSEAADIPGGAIYLRDNAHNNPGLKGLVKAMSVGSDWVVEGKVTNEGQGYSYNACGPGFANGDTTAARVLWMGIQSVDASGGSNFIVGYDYTNYTTLGSGTVISTSAPVVTGDSKWFRITKTGANWTISMSGVSLKFTDLVTEATRFTPTHVGMFCDSRGDGSAPTGFAAGVFTSLRAF